MSVVCVDAAFTLLLPKLKKNIVMRSMICKDALHRLDKVDFFISSSKTVCKIILDQENMSLRIADRSPIISDTRMVPVKYFDCDRCDHVPESSFYLLLKKFHF